MSVTVVGTVEGGRTPTKIKPDLKKAIVNLACHPCLPVLYVAYAEGLIRAYNIHTYVVHYTLQLDNTIKLIGAGALAFHPTLEWIFVGDRKGTLLAWDVSTERPSMIGIKQVGSQPIKSVVFLPMLRLLVTLSKDGNLHVWETRVTVNPNRPATQANLFEPAAIKLIDIPRILSQQGGEAVYPLPRIKALEFHPKLNLAALVFANPWEKSYEDPIEELLYAVFVVSNENASVAELATTLRADLSQLQAAASFVCRLGWATKVIDPSSILQDTSMPGSSRSTVSDEDVSLASHGFDNIHIDNDIQGDALGSSNHGPRSAYMRVAFIVDANITSYLMMGSVSPGRKSHAVTLHEADKLGHASTSDLCKDLSTPEGAKFEGELQEFANHAFSLRCVLECLQSGGVASDVKVEEGHDKMNMATPTNGLVVMSKERSSSVLRNSTTTTGPRNRRDLTWSFTRRTTSDIWKEQFKSNSRKSESAYHVVTDVAILRFMVEVCWGPMLAAFSVTLDQSDDRKNVDAVKAIISIAIEDGDHIQEAWEHILTCLSRIEHLQLLGEGAPSDATFFTSSNFETEERTPKTLAFSSFKKGTLQNPAMVAIVRGNPNMSITSCYCWCAAKTYSAARFDTRSLLFLHPTRVAYPEHLLLSYSGSTSSHYGVYVV
ncbi:hypothetical protein KIW84_043826 [Lathyrus oleraceus]|uniref:Uncharacterized protein n=1 Tax=Pisum sativum TaxID=3888 RepID=A0A9D5AUL0_PEA|nr:hypothetical protein KIW84_043826 [Pisum sativum]